VVVVAVQIDEPRRYQIPRRVDHLRRARLRNRFLDGCDLAILDGDVAARVQLLPGIDHRAARDEQVVLEIGILGIEGERKRALLRLALRCGCRRGRKRRRRVGSEELAS